ncbi:MAG: alpha/beta hydrolase [Muribaculaceae bacterium]
MKKCYILLVMSLFTLLTGKAQTNQTDPQLEAQLSQWVDKQTWVDPVTAVPQGCQYVLYPTTQRGNDTEGSFMIYLPDGYEESTCRYPVIYYLHGGNGNQREGRWMIERIAKAISEGKMQPVIVVCPHAMPIGWYLNGRMEDPKVTTGPIEDVLIKDLIPYVDSHYRTIASREGRGIEGFSMGGCGTMRLAFKYPQLFCAASSVAGAVVGWDEEPLQRALECTFGDVTDPASRQFFEANQPEVFAKQNVEAIRNSGMKVRIFVGTKDRLYDENGNHIIPRFHEYLQSLGIKHGYEVIQNVGHSPWEMFGEGQKPYDVTFWDDAFARLKVGASKASITPTPDCFPVEDFHGGTYKTIHDSLYARAIYLEQGATRVLMVELDQSDADASLVETLSSQTGIAKENILLCASHTHSVIRSEKAKSIVEKGAINAAKQAMGCAIPAYPEFGRTQTFVAVNNGEAALKNGQANHEGYTDRTLDIIRFSDIAKRQPIALILNFASHAEVMFRSMIRPGEYEVSADLPGRVSTLLEASEKGAPVVLSTSGAEGDQLTIYTSWRRTENLGTIDLGEKGYTLLDLLAQTVVDAALTEMQSMKALPTTALSCAQGHATVPGQRMRRNRETGEVTTQATDDVMIPLAAIRLSDDVAIQAIGGDVAAAIGTRIREASPAAHTMLVTMMAGSVGYILTDEAYQHPIHGVMGSKIKPGYAEQAIINGFKEIIK